MNPRPLLIALLATCPLHAQELPKPLLEQVEAAFANTDRLNEQAAAVAALYRQGRRRLADRVVATRGDVVRWDESSRVEVTAVRYRAGALEVHLQRSENLLDPLAVAFPPGILATIPQNPARYPLAVIEAPLIVFERGESHVTQRLRVAAAWLGDPHPGEGTHYVLHAEGRGSSLERLLRQAVQHSPQNAPSVQLALWTLRNQAPPSVLDTPRTTPAGHPVTPAHRCQARALINAADLQADSLPFFATSP